MRDQLARTFHALHHGEAPLLLPNAWDAASARLWERAGAAAIGTSSAAVAWSRGYADGGALPREELLSSLRGMARVLSVPLTADIEDGYSDDPGEVADLAVVVAASGAAGINLEDGAGAPGLLADKIRAIRARLGDTPLFVNARTDVLLRGLAEGDAAVDAMVERLALYREAGADGGFVPGLASASDAARIVAAVPLGLNLMVVPGLAPLAELQRAGVRRISAGPAIFEAAFSSGDAAARAILRGEFTTLPASTLDHATMNALFAPAAH